MTCEKCEQEAVEISRREIPVMLPQGPDLAQSTMIETGYQCACGVWYVWSKP